MYKTLTILFVILYGCFVLFARQPDYFDGEVVPATIHFAKDSASQSIKPFANYSIGVNKYIVAASYPLRYLNEGDRISIIYDPSNLKKAVVYSVWGYWILWTELLAALVGYIVLFQVARGITNNPTPESVIEQLENEGKSEMRKRRYE